MFSVRCHYVTVIGVRPSFVIMRGRCRRIHRLNRILQQIFAPEKANNFKALRVLQIS